MDARQRAEEALRRVNAAAAFEWDPIDLGIIEMAIRQAESDAAREARRAALEEAAKHIESKRKNRHHQCRANMALEIRSLAATKEQG